MISFNETVGACIGEMQALFKIKTEIFIDIAACGGACINPRRPASHALYSLQRFIRRIVDAVAASIEGNKKYDTLSTSSRDVVVIGTLYVD